MIKLKKVLESSARDRLKRRVKDVDTENFNDRQLAPYLKRVAKLYKLNSQKFESRYEFFYKKFVENTPEPKHVYLAGVMSLFTMIDIGATSTNVDLPHNLDQILDKAELHVRKVMKDMHIPEEFDLKTVAILLQALEQHGFKLREI